MQTVDHAPLNAIAAKVLGTDNPEMIGFLMFGWDMKDAGITKDSVPVFSLHKNKRKKENNEQQARKEQLEKLKAAYEANPSHETEISDYVQFGIGLASAFRTHCKGEIPLFLLDEDTLYQVKEEGAECDNLSDLL